MGKIVRKERIGFAVSRDIDNFNNAVKELTLNQHIYQQYAENVKEALLNRHLWKHRVEQIVDDLSGYITK